MRWTTLWLLLCLGAPLLHADATKQYVSLDGSRLLSRPSAFSKNNGLLKQGTLVWADPVKNGYAKVRLDNGKTGYLSAWALQKTRPKFGVSTTRSSDASSEEVAAATKGFNKQIEADARKNGNNELGFQRLDLLLARSQVSNPQDNLAGFRKAGKIGEFSAGGQ